MFRFTDTVAFVAGLSVLGAASVHRWQQDAAPDAAPFHQRIAKAYAALPLQIGKWVGREEEVPTPAVNLLRPTIILSRRYDSIDHRSCHVLIVHCRDARDLVGHFPPVCYPASGWRSLNQQNDKIETAGVTLNGIWYEFAAGRPDQSSGVSVYSVMLIPDAPTGPDMRSVEAAVGDGNRRHYGAAQLQVVVDGMTPQAERDRIVTEMVQIHRPLLDSILKTKS